MEPTNTVRILPLNQWKAYRIISFTIEGIPARLVYKRKLESDKIKIISTPDSFYPEKMNQIPTFPVDELDSLLLSWFKIIDKNSKIDDQLFIINTSEENFLLRYEGLHKTKIDLIALPSFEGSSWEDWIKFEGQNFVQYCQEFEIYLYGHISAKPQLSITGYYKAEDKLEMDKLINRLRAEIIQ